MKSFKYVVVFAAFITITLTGISYSADLVNEKKFVELTELVGSDLSKKDVKKLKALLKDGDKANAALASGLLYRHNSKKYKKTLYKYFVVDDYVARSKGKYNIISTDDFMAEIDSVGKKHSNIKSGGAFLILTYLHFRNDNKWVMKGEQKVSTARFLRTAALAYLFNGSDIDTLAVANDMDKTTAEGHGFKW